MEAERFPVFPVCATGAMLHNPPWWRNISSGSRHLADPAASHHAATRTPGKKICTLTLIQWSITGDCTPKLSMIKF
jgi:hypothetical protein